MVDFGVFDRALDIVLEHEGGYVNDPRDPGGETYRGISRRAHPEAWSDGRPTDEQVRQIYLHDYWLEAHCEALQPAIAVYLFDTAVNVGVSRAVKLLQRAAGVKEDGVIGPVTIGAVNGAKQAELLGLFAAERIRFYAGLSNWALYGRGWAKRAVMVALEAVA